MSKYKWWLIAAVIIIIIGLVTVVAVFAEEVCKASFPTGTKVTLEAKACPNSVFTGWGGACAFVGKKKICTVTIDADKIVIATFKKVPAPKNFRMSKLEEFIAAGSLEMYQSCYEQKKSGEIMRIDL